MLAALVILALLALGVAAFQWRSRRVALANRWLHSIAAAMVALEEGRRVEAPNLSACLLLGPDAANHIKAFFAAAAHATEDRERALVLGEAALRQLRDISTHRHHKLVSRA